MPGAGPFSGRCRASALVRQSVVRPERQNRACRMCSIGKQVAQTRAAATKKSVRQKQEGKLLVLTHLKLALPGDRTASPETNLLSRALGPRFDRVGPQRHRDDDVLALFAV